MYLQVYDQNVKQIGVIDAYTSLIWTKRYNKPGDFEVVMPLEGNIPFYINTDYYVTLSDDLEPGYYMIIETIEIDQEEEGGNVLTISGRSLESLLERRIVWDKIEYSSKKTEDIIKDLITKSIINPSDKSRKIDNFLYESPNESLKFSTVDAEYDGEYLLDAFQALCSEDYNSISVRYLNNNFVYKTYTGTDRSHDQTENEEVLYSASYDSLASSNYLTSVKNYKNIVQVVDSTTNKKIVVGNETGLIRREYRAESQNTTNQSSLKAYGNKILYEYRKEAILDGIAINDAYTYGVDVFVGDIVQFKNNYGIEGRSRITEYIYSEDTS